MGGIIRSFKVADASEVVVDEREGHHQFGERHQHGVVRHKALHEAHVLGTPQQVVRAEIQRA